MSDRITLSLRAPLARPLDADAIAADRFASLGAAELAALQLWDGRTAVAVGDVFTIDGERASTLMLEGELMQLHGVGSMMHTGAIEIAGSIGHSLGARMTGGTIKVRGNAGDDAGTAMSGGSIDVDGNAGDRAGGAPAGASKGMSGGEIIVRGRAGRDAGMRMRRGTLFCGSSDVSTGSAMIAGNIIVSGPIGAGVGAGNKRGSIVALGPVEVPQTYAYACTYRPPHLSLMLRSLRARFGLPIDDAHLHGLYKRYSGDLVEIGKGEIFEWQATR